MAKRFGIVGCPLGHTMSPTLHNWGFDQLSVDGVYEAWPLRSADLPAFVGRVRREPIVGLSVTIPHKQAVMPLLDRLSDRARVVGAVNTLYWDGGELCGDNTDVLGIVAPLRKLDCLPASALVLGAGGAARAALAGFRELGIGRVAVSNRTKANAEALAAEFNASCVEWGERMDTSWELICNTTPLGMSGDLEDVTPWDAARFTAGSTIYDIVYNPLKPRFLREAEAAGCATISGLEMFLHQGMAQFRLWTGLDMDEADARNLLLNALKG